MANKQKAKGTAEETAVVKVLADTFGASLVRRTAPGTQYDIHVAGWNDAPPLEVLVTRPDYGKRLYSIREDDFLALMRGQVGVRNRPLHVEVKRRASVWIHTVFAQKFGGTR